MEQSRIPAAEPLMTPSTDSTRAVNSRWVGHRFVAQPGDKCQHPRQRCPNIEAGIQVFFRIICCLLHLTAFVVLLIAQQILFMWPYQTFISVTYGVILNIAEITSLTAPGFDPFPRFPRLPSLWLAICEAIGIALVMWSLDSLLQPIWREKDDQGRYKPHPFCPIETCVTSEERYGLAVYTCQLVTLVIQIGFFAMALKHWLQRRGLLSI